MRPLGALVHVRSGNASPHRFVGGTVTGGTSWSIRKKLCQQIEEEHENGSRVCEEAYCLGFLTNEIEVRYPGSYTPFYSRRPYLAFLAPEEKGCVSKTYLTLEG